MTEKDGAYESSDKKQVEPWVELRIEISYSLFCSDLKRGASAQLGTKKSHLLRPEIPPKSCSSDSSVSPPVIIGLRRGAKGEADPGFRGMVVSLVRPAVDWLSFAALTSLSKRCYRKTEKLEGIRKIPFDEGEKEMLQIFPFPFKTSWQNISCFFFAH